MKRWLIYSFVLLICINCTPARPEAVLEAEALLPETIDYNYHIKPILSDRCYKCHGPDDNTREADLRFDLEEDAKARLPETGNIALVPGSLRKSAVFHRLVTEDPEEMMPPPESNLHITAEEKAYILKWIEQGAVYKPHWSFIAPERPAVPATDQPDRGVNQIDTFVLAGMTVTFDGTTEFEDLPGTVTNGQFVEVEGILDAATSITATRIELEDEDFGIDVDRISIEGIVTDFQGVSNFKVALLILHLLMFGIVPLIGHTLHCRESNLWRVCI